jgi:hypothetical protein
MLTPGPGFRSWLLSMFIRLSQSSKTAFVEIFFTAELFSSWSVFIHHTRALVYLTVSQTHNIALTGDVADTITQLSEGRVVNHGPTSKVISSDEALQLEIRQGDELEVTRKPKVALTIAEPKPILDQKGDGKLITKEHVAEGRISWNICQSRYC